MPRCGRGGVPGLFVYGDGHAMLNVQHIHWADFDANSTLNAGRIAIVDGQLMLGKALDVNAHLACPCAVSTPNAAIIGLNRNSGNTP